MPFSRQILSRPSRPHRTPASRRAQCRVLRFEPLENRLPLAQISFVDTTFREDEFAISGNFTYRLHEPDESDYIDTINNGEYSSNLGRLEWTSPTAATGSFRGTATGDGRDTVEVAGRRNCSEYGIEEQGGFNFKLDAAVSQLQVTSTPIDSSRYTYYRDLTGGFCPQSDPPWFRFFTGRGQDFTGTFSTADHQVSIQYSKQTGQSNWTMNAPAATLDWVDDAPTDLELQATPLATTVETPVGWIPVAQSTLPLPSETIDIQHGRLNVIVAVTGKPVLTSAPTQVMGQVRLFWAASESDFTGTEIPLSTTQPADLYWNSRHLQVVVEDFPQPPAHATHLRVTVDAHASLDQQAANSSAFVRIGTFSARDVMGSEVTADGYLDLPEGSLLHPLDRQDPLIRVLGYLQQTTAGGEVSVYDEGGGFLYVPAYAPSFPALAPDQTATDVIRFLAIYNQSLVDEASYTVTVRGVNDAPLPVEDTATTGNYADLTLAAATLLANDLEIDQGDRLAITSVDMASGWGATVSVVLSDDQTEVREIRYLPSTSVSLRTIPAGQEVLDYFNYQVTDRFGGQDYGVVYVTVTSDGRQLNVQPVPPQLTTANQPTAAIPIVIDDPDGDASDVILTAYTYDSSLLPAEGFQWSGSGANRELLVSPSPDVTGRTRIVITAMDSLGITATRSIAFVVGTSDDGDLDGVTDADEDEAPNNGDMNADGTPDRQQAHVVSWMWPETSQFVNIVAAGSALVSEVHTDASPASSGPAEGAEFPLGLLQFTLDATPGEQATEIDLRLSESDVVLNRIYGYTAAEVGGNGWDSLMRRAAAGATIFVDRVTFTLLDGGVGDSDASFDGRIHAAVGLATVNFPWRNLVREDVDNDGFVSPLDALLLINQLNSRGARGLGSRPTGTESIPHFLDPSGNGSLEPLDVLIVINFLNGVPAGEGESGEVAPVDQVFASWGRESSRTKSTDNSRGESSLPLLVTTSSPLSDTAARSRTNSVLAAVRSLNKRSPLREISVEAKLSAEDYWPMQ